MVEASPDDLEGVTDRLRQNARLAFGEARAAALQATLHRLATALLTVERLPLATEDEPFPTGPEPAANG